MKTPVWAEAARPWFAVKLSLGWQGWPHSHTCLTGLRGALSWERCKPDIPPGGTHSCQMQTLLPPSFFPEKNSVGHLLCSAANDQWCRSEHVRSHIHISNKKEIYISNRRHYQLEPGKPRSEYTNSGAETRQLFSVHFRNPLPDTLAAPKIQPSEKNPYTKSEPKTNLSFRCLDTNKCITYCTQLTCIPVLCCKIWAACLVWKFYR